MILLTLIVVHVALLHYTEAAIVKYGEIITYVAEGEAFSFQCSEPRDDGIELYRNKKLVLSIDSSCDVNMNDNVTEKYTFKCIYGDYYGSTMHLNVRIAAEFMTKDEHNSTWECYRKNGYRNPWSPRKVLRIKLLGQGRLDEIPQIEGYTSGSRLMTSDSPLQLSCKIRKIVYGISLSWQCPSYVSENVTHVQNHIISTIHIRVTEDLNGKTCYCIANYSMDNYITKSEVTFRVLESAIIDERTGLAILAIGSLLFVISLLLTMISCRVNRYKKWDERKIPILYSYDVSHDQLEDRGFDKK